MRGRRASQDLFPWDPNGLCIADGVGMLLGRREFLERAAVFAATISLYARRQSGPRLLVTFIHPLEEVADGTEWGVRLGVEEAQRSAAMFGGSVELHMERIPFDPAHPAPPRISLPREQLHVVIPGLMDRRLFAGISEVARDAGALMFDARRDREEAEECRRHAFHLRPSPAPILAAGRSLPASTAGEFETWSPRLTRFGADTLNKRYRTFASRSMDSSAWAGWFAVKCAWEAALQSKARTSDVLAQWLERPATRFDGHKGAPLYFAPNHELVQPLYLVRNGEVIGETDPVAPKTTAACA